MAGRRDAALNRADQERFRARQLAELNAYREVVPALLDALATACESTGTDTLCRRLPDDPIEGARELTRRLGGKRLVCFNRKETTHGSNEGPEPGRTGAGEG